MSSVGTDLTLSESLSASTKMIDPIFRDTNQEFTQMSWLPKRAIFSIPEFSDDPEILDAALSWSNGDPLILLEGGDAWRTMKQLEIRQQEKNLNCEITLLKHAADDYIFCIEQFKTHQHKSISRTSCLIAVQNPVKRIGLSDHAEKLFELRKLNPQQQQQQRQSREEQQQQQQPQQRQSREEQ